jgi:hypothetical protein
MIRTITWTQFFTVVGGLVALYYAIVVPFCFRGKKTSKPKQKNGTTDALAGISVSEKDIGSETEETAGPAIEKSASTKSVSDRVDEPDLYPIANELVETIDEYIVNAGKSQMPKEELATGIQRLIGQYPMLQVAGFKIAISNYIGIALKNNCSFGLDDLEMATLWSVEKKT